MWKWIPAKGRFGCILTGINTDKLEVGSFREGKYMLQKTVWDKLLKVKWSFLNVYGAAQEENKDEFLAELARFCDTCKDPILVGGDFNIIRFACEKNKNNGVHKHTDLFNSIIASQELIEIQMTGGRFTLSNNQEFPTLEKLDRDLDHKSWESIFPTALVYKLPRELSDHNPLILTTQSNVPITKLSFKFELTWLKDPNFLPTVQKLWNKPCFAKTPLDRVQAKLKRFRQHFKGWGFNG